MTKHIFLHFWPVLTPDRRFRGRIRVQEDDSIALFPKRFTGLCARIVELTSLSDPDRAGPDHENRFDVVSTFLSDLPVFVTVLIKEL